MPTILVTGAAGFIGSNLVDHLLRDPRNHVIGVDNFDPFYDRKIKERYIKPACENSRYHFWEMSVCDPDQMTTIFRNHPIDVAIHLAAKAGVRPSFQDPIGYARTNVLGTQNILQTMANHGVRRLIFASSSSVYGNNPKVPFSPEDRVDEPISPYAATKKTGELLCHVFHKTHGMTIASIRFFTVYGPRQRPDLAIHQFTRNILHGESITLYGDGTSSRDYTHIDDTLEGLSNCVEWLTSQDRPQFEILNFGASQPISLTRLVELIERATGKKATILWKEKQPGDVERTWANIQKSETLVHYKPRIPIEEGITRFVTWAREFYGL